MGNFKPCWVMEIEELYRIFYNIVKQQHASTIETKQSLEEVKLCVWQEIFLHELVSKL